MQGTARLMASRQFVPLFVTQFLNAFNDNFFKMAMVMLATYTILQGGEAEEASYNALAGAIFILPFFALSAVAGQLADMIDKTRVIRMVKTAEIGIMAVGAAGLWLHNTPLMFLALFAMGVHSTFFGPIKYGILPQHLPPDDVLGGTGLVEAGTYIAILSGTVVGGLIPAHYAAVGVLAIALVGRAAAQYVPPAPPEADAPKGPIDWNIFRSSWTLVKATMHVRRLFMAIVAISFFWAIGTVLAAQFPPLVKSEIGADRTVATLFTAIFSVGVAIGSVAINRLLKGQVSARWSPISVIVMGAFVLLLWWSARQFSADGIIGAGEQGLLNWRQFLSQPDGDFILLALLGVAISGGMFVVPLYAFLTTIVAKSETSRTVAANNIVNAGAMVLGAVVYGALTALGVQVVDTLLLVAGGCLVAAVIAWRLHRICEDGQCTVPAHLD